jgi:DNA (cytosine-5)-methyltransferase 1
MRAANFEHAQLVERDERACAILRANAKRRPTLWSDDSIRQMDVLDWLLEVDDLGLDDVDLVAGGPPCQPFSISGAHAGHNDERNMFPATIEAIRRLRPKLFVFENVPGLMRDSFLPYYEYIRDQLSKPDVVPNRGELWETHHRRVRRARPDGLRYRVDWRVINAADLGVPQVRPRVFLIGVRSDLPHSDSRIEIPPTHGIEALLRAQWIVGDYWEEHSVSKPPTMPPRLGSRVRLLHTDEFIAPLERWRTIRDALVGLPEPVDYTDADGFLNHGGIPGARSYHGHTGSPIDWPAKALKAGVHGVCGGEAMIRFLDDSVRYLTIREAARVQSIPDDYDLAGTRTAAMRALGNAVAMEVAHLIGVRLGALLDEMDAQQGTSTVTLFADATAIGNGPGGSGTRESSPSTRPVGQEG